MILLDFNNLVDAPFFNFFWTKLKQIVELKRAFLKLVKNASSFCTNFFHIFHDVQLQGTYS